MAWASNVRRFQQLAHREPNGRAQRPTTRAARAEERKEDIMRTALAQPHRLGTDSALAGFALGRLKLQGLINADQFNAGETFTRLHVRYLRDVLGALPRLRSTSAVDSPGGLGCAPEPDEDDVLALRRDHADMLSALADVGELDTIGILAAVCVMDKDPTHFQIGTLRLSLNRLHRLWT